MGGPKKATREPLAIEVSFDCPTPGCDEIVEGAVVPAYFDSTRETAALGYSRITIQCGTCKGTFTLEIIADAEGQLMKIDNFPEIEVWFEDSQLQAS
jgi:hypothetical protein